MDASLGEIEATFDEIDARFDSINRSLDRIQILLWIATGLVVVAGIFNWTYVFKSWRSPYAFGWDNDTADNPKQLTLSIRRQTIENVGSPINPLM